MASSSSSLSSSFNDLPETRFVVTHSDKNDAEQQGENSNNHHNHAGILDVGRIAAAPVGATTTASVSSRTTSSNHNSNNNRDLEYYGGQPLQQRDEDDEEDRFHDIPVSKSAEERDCMAAAEHSTKAYRENRNASDHQTTSYHSNSLSRFLLRPSLLLFGGRSNTNNSSATEEETEGSDSEIPVHHMECSLPTVEELRHQHERMDSNNTNNKKQPCDDDNHPKEQQSTTRRRRKRSAVLWILLLLVVLVLVAAVVLRTTTNKTKLDEAVAFLTHCNVSSIEALQTPTSPQAQAIQWLTYDDSYNLAVPSYSLQHQHSTTMAAHMLITNDTETNRYIARYTLVLAYFALSGPTWWFQLDFLTAQHECDWHSPLVNAAESHFGVHCDSDQRPVHLRLRK